jgi:hypothetical protein
MSPRCAKRSTQPEANAISSAAKRSAEAGTAELRESGACWMVGGR